MSSTGRSWVEISLSQIKANYSNVHSAVAPGVEIMPVVKADAYGHGAAQVSSVLTGAGARWLAVASVDEGIALRTAGISARIVVMAGILRHEWEAVAEHGLTPVLHGLDDLGASAGRRLAVHLKLDSGLGRLGAREDIARIVEAVRNAPDVTLEGVMTHLASPENFESPQSDEQLGRFSQLLEALSAAGIRPPYVHVSSTNAIAYGRRHAWKTMVRPGIGIYGYLPRPVGEPPERLLTVKPVLEWKAAVLRVKEVAAGEPIGYGATFRAPRPSRIATIAAGYADGYPHCLGNRAKVIVNGVLCPLAGVVSMDLLTVDVTDAPPAVPGQAVTLLGREGGVSLDAQDLADLAGTIPYVILCGIGPRVRRVYI